MSESTPVETSSLGELITGNPELDQEHVQLLTYLERLGRPAAAGEQGESLREILRHLTSYATAHFQAEELLMRRSGYPGDQMAAHEREHQAFLAELGSFSDAAETGQEAPGRETLGFMLSRWFVRHILGSDHRLAKHLREQGWSDHP